MVTKKERIVPTFISHARPLTPQTCCLAGHARSRSHAFVAQGHVLVDDLLGDALACGVVVELEVGFATAFDAAHFRHLARSVPRDLGDLFRLVLDEVTHLVVGVVVASRIILGIVISLILDVRWICAVLYIIVHVQQPIVEDFATPIRGIAVRQVVHRRARLVVAGQVSDVAVRIVGVGGLVVGAPVHLRTRQTVQFVIDEVACLRAEGLAGDIGEIRGHPHYVTVVQGPSPQVVRRHGLAE